MSEAHFGDIEILPDAAAVAHRAAAWLVERAAARGRMSICLSGGDQARLVYRALADDHRHSFPWDRVHWFWGDERFVPSTDSRSNLRMVKEALLDRVPVPDGNVHPIPTEGLSLARAAAAYERVLKEFYGESTLRRERPLFDATILGLGEDGHTASLFPGAPVLEERRKWVAPVEGFAPEPRITLTYPVLESSAHAAFIVAGRETRAALSAIRQGKSHAPSARLRPVGHLTWFVDRAAAPEENGSHR